MGFRFSGSGLVGKDKTLQRVFEIIPGLTSWTIILGMFFLAVFKPLIAAVIIIAFYLYWLLRLLYITIFLVLSYFRLSAEKTTDWMERVRGVDRLDEYLEELKAKPLEGNLEKRTSLFCHRKDLEALKKAGGVRPLSKDIYHVVIIPVVKETRDVVEPGIKSLAEGTFPSEKMLVVLAQEERASDGVKAGVRGILDDYKGKFFDMLVITHPDGIVERPRLKAPIRLSRPEKPLSTSKRKTFRSKM